MPDLRNLSGQEVVSILKQFGFMIFSQKGSHVKLRRIVDGNKQSLTIPLHRELDKGTLKAIIKQASRFVMLDELKELFYH